LLIANFLCGLPQYPKLAEEELSTMRTSLVFLLGILLGSAIPTSLAQGSRVTNIDNVNHVAIALDNFDEGFAFYTQKMGFREVVTQRNPQGQVMYSFVQAGRNTFLELSPASANRPAGLNHFGLQVQNMAATVAALKDRGLTVSDPRTVGPGWSIASVTGYGNVRIELSELGPDAELTKATNSLK
jgi:catechol 2,3-dioxygenase-like lactoylglutathione lyase family enzyme